MTIQMIKDKWESDDEMSLKDAFIEVFKECSKAVRRSMKTAVKLDYSDKPPGTKREDLNRVQLASPELCNCILNMLKIKHEFDRKKVYAQNLISSQEEIIELNTLNMETLLKGQDDGFAQVQSVKRDKQTTYSFKLGNRKKASKRKRPENVSMKYSVTSSQQLMSNVFDHTFDESTNDTDIMEQIESDPDNFLETITRVLAQCTNAIEEQLQEERIRENEERLNGDDSDTENYIRFEKEIVDFSNEIPIEAKMRG